MNVVRLQTRTLDWTSAVSAFLNHAECKGLSNRTIEYYRERLRKFTCFTEQRIPPIAPDDVSTQLVSDFIQSERQTNSVSTANHGLAVLKNFFGYLKAEGYMEGNPAAPVEKLKSRQSVIETFTPDQVEAILSTCKKDFYGVRDRAVLLVLLDTGLRVSELCGLSLDDVNWTEQTFRIVGKGDKERVVPFGQGVRQALATYVANRGDLTTGALFVGHYGDALDRFRVREVVKKRSEQAGIKGVRPSPHTLRHTCAVSYLRAGGDTFTLQRLLGHSSQEMTKRYCESLSAADVQKKHRQFSPVDNMKLSDRTAGRKRLQ